MSSARRGTMIKAVLPGPADTRSNYDQLHVATRLGAAQARVVAMLLTLRGTLTIYYGEEIGMTNTAFTPNLVKDPVEINHPDIGRGREPERTPKPWYGLPEGGFTTAKPWLAAWRASRDQHGERERRPTFRAGAVEGVAAPAARAYRADRWCDLRGDCRGRRAALYPRRGHGAHRCGAQSTVGGARR